MRLYLSDSLPSLQLTFPSGNPNEYRLRQGGVEFRVDQKAWRLLDESDVQFHFALHTEVAKWLQARRAELA
jgi:hypothetical protein